MPSTDPSMSVGEGTQGPLNADVQATVDAVAMISVAEDAEGPNVGTPSDDYLEMAARWALITDLRGGTLRMQEAGEDWLPREEKESTTKYGIRLSRSFLFEHYADSVERLASRPFAKKVSLIGDVPSALEPLETNTDRVGTSLTDFGEAVLEDAEHYGLTHILVDFSPVPAGASLADEKASGARAAFKHIPAADMIGWKVGLTPAGDRFLTEIRWRERVTVYEGLWGEEARDRVRVFRMDTWELWERRQDADDRWHWWLIEDGKHTFKRIPLVTLYTRKVGFMMARPALESLAYTNLAHYQSASEQRNLLRFARIGILFGTGFTEEEVEKGINLSPTSFVATTNEGATLQYVEHQGGAMEIGREDLLQLERQMDVQAMKPLVTGSTGTVSATGQAIEEAKAISALQAWARGCEVVLEQAYQLAAEWHKTKLPEDFKVDIFSDFSITPRVRDDVMALLEARQMGEISRETLLSELQRRGLLSDHRDIDEEIAAAKKDGPPESSNPGLGGGLGLGVRNPNPDDRDRGGPEDPRDQTRGTDTADGHEGAPR